MDIFLIIIACALLIAVFLFREIRAYLFVAGGIIIAILAGSILFEPVGDVANNHLAAFIVLIIGVIMIILGGMGIHKKIIASKT